MNVSNILILTIKVKVNVFREMKFFSKKYFVVSKKCYTFAPLDMSLVSGDVILLSVKF